MNEIIRSTLDYTLQLFTLPGGGFASVVAADRVTGYNLTLIDERVVESPREVIQ